MISNPLEYSSVFSFDAEPDKFLARKKKSVAENFKFSVVRQMSRACLLTYWLHVFKKDEEAIAVCDFLMQKEFDGDVCIWFHVGRAIGLKYVIEKQLYDHPPEYYNYRRRIIDAHEANVKMRAKSESDVRRFGWQFEGFLNGQVIEMELWAKEIVCLTNIADSCIATMRELCWLIATNEYLGRKSFHIGGQKGDCTLFWDKYYLYLDTIDGIRK